MDLQNTFYILAITFMVLFIILLVVFIMLLLFVKKKVGDLHETIDQKIQLVTHPTKETGELAAGLGSVVAGLAMKKVQKAMRKK